MVDRNSFKVRNFILTSFLVIAYFSAIEAMGRHYEMFKNDWYEKNTPTKLTLSKNLYRIQDKLDLDRVPPDINNRSLLLGNSHVYAIPFKEQTMYGVITGAEGVLADRLAYLSETGASKRNLFSIAAPNLTPVEMLLVLSKLKKEHMRPTNYIVGIVYHNINFPLDIRPALKDLLLDEEIMSDVASLLGSDSPTLTYLEKVRKELVASKKKELKATVYVDIAEEYLWSDLSNYSAFARNRKDFRTYISSKLLDVRGVLFSSARGAAKIDCTSCEEVNMAAIRALVKYIGGSSTPSIVYFAPYYPDPAFVRYSVEKEEKAISRILAWGREAHVDVLNLRNFLPKEMYGWGYGKVDPSHYFLEGHDQLAQKIWSEYTK